MKKLTKRTIPGVSLSEETEDDSTRDGTGDLAGNIGTNCVHEEMIRRVFSETHLLDHTGAHRECRNAGGTDHRVDLLLSEEINELCEQYTTY